MENESNRMEGNNTNTVLATVLSPSQIEHQIEMDEEEDRYWMDNDDSDDEFDENVDFTCNFCELSPRGSHAINCPNNDSPFAQLVRDGYD
jgi:hypothetical protein